MSTGDAFQKGAQLAQQVITTIRELRRLMPSDDFTSTLESEFFDEVVKTFEGFPELTVCHGRIMGTHAHKWIRIETHDPDQGKHVWLIDILTPGAMPRPLVLMPGCPLQRAYLET